MAVGPGTSWPCPQHPGRIHHQVLGAKEVSPKPSLQLPSTSNPDWVETGVGREGEGWQSQDRPGCTRRQELVPGSASQERPTCGLSQDSSSM